MKPLRSSLCLAFLLAACTPAGSASPMEPGPEAPPGLATTYCELATRGDLRAWIGDVVTLCEAGDPSACRLSRVDAEGVVTPLPWSIGQGIVLGLPAAGGFAVLHADGRLALRDAGGAETSTLAAWAADPQTSEDGARLAFVALAEGETEWEPGVPTRILVADLTGSAGASPETVSADALAFRPFPLAGAPDVLFASSAGGVASIWIGAPGEPASQLTNAGLSPLDVAQLRPVPGNEATWSRAHLVFSAPGGDGRSELWDLDVFGGTLSSLGEGRQPITLSDGRVRAQVRDPRASGCSIDYAPGATP